MDYQFQRLTFLLAIFTLLYLSSAAYAPTKLVKEICQQTAKSYSIPKYNDCIEALSKDPKSATEKIEVLAKLTLQLGISSVTDTKTYIDKLVSTSPALSKPLKSCSSSYAAAISSFKSALAEIEEDPSTVSYDVRVAGDEIKECEDELTRDKATIPELTKRNLNAHLYANIGIVVTDRLG